MNDAPPRSRVRSRPAQEAPARPSVHSAPEASGDRPRIGYCRPPEAHQFKPGRSGNPRGRPKGSRNIATIVAEVLSRRISTRINGERQRILPTEALVQVVLRKALGGDRHAWETVFRWVEESEVSKERREAVSSLDEKDAEILRRMQERFSQGGELS